MGREKQSRAVLALQSILGSVSSGPTRLLCENDLDRAQRVEGGFLPVVVFSAQSARQPGCPKETGATLSPVTLVDLEGNNCLGGHCKRSP